MSDKLDSNWRQNNLNAQRWVRTDYNTWMNRWESASGSDDGKMMKEQRMGGTSGREDTAGVQGRMRGETEKFPPMPLTVPEEISDTEVKKAEDLGARVHAGQKHGRSQDRTAPRRTHPGGGTQVWQRGSGQTTCRPGYPQPRDLLTRGTLPSGRNRRLPTCPAHRTPSPLTVPLDRLGVLQISSK